MKGVIECSKSELDLFSEPLLQTGILGTTEVAYKPINSLGDDPSVIEFACPGHGDTYRDLSSVYLKLKVRLMKDRPDVEHTTPQPQAAGASGGARTDSDVTSVVNNLLHSLFRQVSIYMNGVPISQTNMDYAYRAYLENLLNYGADASSTHLDSVLWMLDEGDVDTLDKNKNKGFNARYQRLKNSKSVELYGRVHSDMFNQHRLLLNSVDLRIVFSVEKPEFYVLEKATGKSFIRIESATLYMNHIQINPNVLLANEMTLTRQPAIYPYKRVEIKAYTAPANGKSISIDNAVLGTLPNLILFAMVDNDAYTGKRELNGFNFRHNNISQYYITVNGVSVPSDPYEFDYSKPEDSVVSTRAYLSLFKDLGIHYYDRGHQINKKFFDNGCFIIASDLTADRSTEIGTCSNILNQGTVRIEARFKEALKKPVTCLVYCEYDSVIKIDKDRNVYTHF